MKYFVLSVLLFLIIQTNGQVPLIKNNTPNREINKLVYDKSIRCITLNYEKFISYLNSDSVLKYGLNINNRTSSLKNFEVYVIPEAYFIKYNDDSIKFNNYLIKIIKIDTNKLFSRVYFQKANSTYIQMKLRSDNTAHIELMSHIYQPEEKNDKNSKRIEKRFHKYILKQKPDNLFIIRGFDDYICFQRGLEIYYFDFYSYKVKPLINLIVK